MSPRRLYLPCFAAAVAMSFVSLVPLGPLRVFEHKTLDLRFKVREMLRRTPARGADVALVAADEAAVRALATAPALTEASAGAVEALSELPVVVGLRLPAALADSTGLLESAARAHLLEVLETHAARVVVSPPAETAPVAVDDDGVARRVQLFERGRPAFCLRLGCAVLGVPESGLRIEHGRTVVLRDAAGRVVRRIPVDAAGRMLVDSRKPEIAPVSLVDAGRDPAVRGARAVLLGPTARSLTDFHPTPLAPRTSEVEILAEATSTLLAGRFVRPAPVAAQILVNALFLVAAAWLLVRLTPVRAVLAGLGLMALYFVTEKLAFIAGGVWLDFMRPMTALQASIVFFPLWAYAQRSRTLLGEMAEVRRFDDLALHLMSSGLLATDAEGRVLKSNARAATLLGRDGQKLEGRTLAELFAPSPQALAFIARVVPQPATEDEGPSCSLVPSRAPVVFAAGGDIGDVGDVILDLSVSVSDALHLSEAQRGARVYVLTFSDVTESVRLAADDERRARLAAVGEIAAKLGHEIRNSLGGLRLYVENVRDDMPAGGTGRRAIDSMVEEIAVLTHKIEELREYGRDPATERAACDVKAVVDDALLFARAPLHVKNIQVTIESPPHLPRLALDRRQMRDAFQNLIHNAIDAAPAGGTLRVVLEKVGTSNGIGPAGAVLVHFEDDGPGIPASVGDQVFALFFTTKPDGTGLGLPIVKKIVEGHGGRVTYRSEPGCTRFTVMLPGGSPRPAGVRAEIEA